VIELIGYEDHLRKTQADCETRWENVKELITFATEVEEQNLRDSEALSPVSSGASVGASVAGTGTGSDRSNAIVIDDEEGDSVETK